MRYYQLGGFRPDIRWFEGDWNDEKILDLLAGPGSPLIDQDRPLELVLGIKRIGSSHLLLADPQASTFEKRGKKRPYRSSTIADFESVSPIYFNSASDLKKKFGVLKPKARKGKKDEPWDTSQANKSYTAGDQGVLRGEFENGRVLYRLLRNAINPTVYSVYDSSWAPNIHFVSFTCNLRAFDTRSYAERQKNPRPLDYGWAEAKVTDSGISFDPGSAVHLIKAEDRLLKTGRRDEPFKHGSTKIENQERIEVLARSFFEKMQAENVKNPTVLLVHDEKLARNALRELGVENSTWISGIANLLRPQRSGLDYGGGRNDFVQRQQRARDRSRSPTRRNMAKPEPGPSSRQSQRAPSPFEEKGQNPIYVVDVRALYWTMMKSQSEKQLGEIAAKLGILEEANCWCAGNEAVYIFDVWQTMMSDAAIDDQRASRMTSTNIAMANERPKSDAADLPTVANTEDSDEEFDPNDIVQTADKSEGQDNYDSDSASEYE
ncbi:hypothetical protein Agabi119p4_10213 [Agaricus bisporus var. burnettii]|uniref:Uncharacterized protein n=1 Tax=Agaricus bisporus var. burnettii TaxID=192524 RepID=A0A8H7C365_AGABI|nr:hypothetical protein Agabi119p4_10213 [Agaricus bisporus var. burnettii]